VQVEKAALAEEGVDRGRRGVSHAEHGPDGVRARSQVSDGAQVLEGVSLLLERVVVAYAAHELHLARADLEALPLAGRVAQLAGDANRTARPQRQHLALVPGQIRVGNHLDPR
jgi:hypothetical protein